MIGILIIGDPQISGGSSNQRRHHLFVDAELDPSQPAGLGRAACRGACPISCHEHRSVRARLQDCREMRSSTAASPGHSEISNPVLTKARTAGRKLSGHFVQKRTSITLSCLVGGSLGNGPEKKFRPLVLDNSSPKWGHVFCPVWFGGVKNMFPFSQISLLLLSDLCLRKVATGLPITLPIEKIESGAQPAAGAEIFDEKSPEREEIDECVPCTAVVPGPWVPHSQQAHDVAEFHAHQQLECE
jgi:hypothetical protein